MPDCAGATSCRRAAPKVKVRARRAKDRRPRILCDHETIEGGSRLLPPGDAARDPERQPVGPQRPVDGDGAQGSQRTPLPADRPEPALRRLVDLEEDVGFVFLHQPPPFLARPEAHRAQRLLQPVERHLGLRDAPAGDQQPADGGVGMAVAAGVGETGARPVRKTQPPRALHLQQEELDPVAQIGERRGAVMRRSILDLAPLGKSLQPAVRPQSCCSERDPAGRGQGRLVQSDEILGPRQHRRLEPRLRPAARLDVDLVIAGEKAGRREPQRREMAGEEGVGGDVHVQRRAARRNERRRGRARGALFGAGAEDARGGVAKHGERCAEIVHGETRQSVETDGFGV
jgi:hypothetical protein